jgi:hypothetical protein
MFALAQAAEGEWRWRFFDHDGHLQLVIAATDEGTDDLGSLMFSCKRASGSVRVRGVMGDDLRKVMADLVRDGGYPWVELVPGTSNDGNVLDISFSEVVGWEYQFSFEAETAAFEHFARTGEFQFKLSETLFQQEFKVGLESAAAFRNACRKPPPPTPPPFSWDSIPLPSFRGDSAR